MLFGREMGGLGQSCSGKMLPKVRFQRNIPKLFCHDVCRTMKIPSNSPTAAGILQVKYTVKTTTTNLSQEVKLCHFHNIFCDQCKTQNSGIILYVTAQSSILPAAQAKGTAFYQSVKSLQVFINFIQVQYEMLFTLILIKINKTQYKINHYLKKNQKLQKSNLGARELAQW